MHRFSGRGPGSSDVAVRAAAGPAKPTNGRSTSAVVLCHPFVSESALPRFPFPKPQR